MTLIKSLFVAIVVLFISGCINDNPPHIQYKKGEFWPANFRNNIFPSKAYKDDRIYCSSIELGDDRPNFFYCFNLKTGKVDWATQVKSWASQPPIVCDSFIYYCTCLGDIYKFDKAGNQIWHSDSNNSYGGHALNPLNNNLIVSTVVYGLREIDCNTGKVVDSIGYNKMNVPLPVFKGDTILQVISDTLFCYTGLQKIKLWKIKTGNEISKLFFNNNLVYYFDDSKCLHCINSMTGEGVWKSDSIFDKQPILPRIEFEDGKMLCYFSTLNDITVMDIKNGKLLRRADYKTLQKENYLQPMTKMYSVKNEGKDYQITVANDLFGVFNYRDEFEISIK